MTFGGISKEVEARFEVGLGAAVVIALSTISFILIIFLCRTRRVKAIGQIRRIEGANGDNGYPYMVVFASGNQTDVGPGSVIKLTLRGTMSDSCCFIFKSLDDAPIIKRKQWNTFLVHTLGNLGDVMEAEIEFVCPNASNWFLKYLLVINVKERRQWYLGHHRCLQTFKQNPVVVHLATHKNQTLRLFQDNISRCMTRFHIWLNPFYEHTADDLKDLLKGLVLGFLLGGLLFSSLLVYAKLTSQDTSVNWEVPVIAVVAHMLVGIIAQMCFLLIRRISEPDDNIKRYKFGRYKSENTKHRKISSRETENEINNQYDRSDQDSPKSEFQTVLARVWSSLRPNKTGREPRPELIKSNKITDEQQAEIESFSKDIVNQCFTNVKNILRDKPQTSLVGFLLQMSNSNRNVSSCPGRKILNRRRSEDFLKRTPRRSPQACTTSDSDLRTHNREAGTYQSDIFLGKDLPVHNSQDSWDSGIGSIEDIHRSLKLGSSPKKFSSSIIGASFLGGLDLLRLTALRGFQRINNSRQSGFEQMMMYFKIPWIETENPHSCRESIEEMLGTSTELFQSPLPDCLNEATPNELEDIARFCFLGILSEDVIRKTKDVAADLTLRNCKDFSCHLLSSLYDIKREIESFHDQDTMDCIFDHVNRMLTKEVLLNSSLTDDLSRVGLAGQYLATVIMNATLRTQVALAKSRNFCHVKIHLSENRSKFTKHFDEILANRCNSPPREMILNKIVPLITDLYSGHCADEATFLDPEVILTRIVCQIHKILVGREIREKASTGKRNCCKLCRNSCATRKLVHGMLETTAGYHLVLRVLTTAAHFSEKQCQKMQEDTTYIYPKLLSDLGRVLQSSSSTMEEHLETLKSVTDQFTKDMVVLGTTRVVEELITVLMVDTPTARYFPDRLKQFLKYLQIQLDADNNYSNVSPTGLNDNNNARITRNDLKELREEFQDMRVILTNLRKEDAEDAAILHSSSPYKGVEKTGFFNWIKTLLYKSGRTVVESFNRLTKGSDSNDITYDAKGNRVHGKVRFKTDETESNNSNDLEEDIGVSMVHTESAWKMLEMVPKKWDTPVLCELLEDVRLNRNLSRRFGYGLVTFLSFGCIAFAFGILVLSAEISAPPTAPWLLTAILAVFLHTLIIEPVKVLVIAYFYAQHSKTLA